MFRWLSILLLASALAAHSVWAGTARVVQVQESSAAATSTIVIISTDLEAVNAFLRVGQDSGEVIATPAVGQRVFFHLRFRLDGPGSPFTVRVEASLDGSAFCSTQASVTSDGTYVAFCNDGWTATAGSHALEWEAALVGVLEPTLSNNSTARFWNSSAGSDIEAVRAFLRSGPNSGSEVVAPAPGEEVFFHVQRRDVDLPTGAEFFLRAEIDGERFCGGSFSAGSGLRNAWCLSGWTVTPGAHTLRWVIDEDDRVAETFEGNNIAELTWIAEPPSTPTTSIPSTPTTSIPSTPTPTNPTETPEIRPTPTLPGPRFRSAPDIIGDCNFDLRVAINELITGVRIALGIESYALCPVFDPDRSFTVSIAELIRAVNVALNGAPEYVPPPDVVLQVVPGALMLDAGDSGATLRVEAYASHGATVGTDDLDIEWIASDPDLLHIEPDASDPAIATVTVLEPICSAVVVARLRDHPRIVSAPVNVSRAKLHPEAEILPDDRVVFPPPNLPAGVDLGNVEIPEMTPANGPGGGTSFAGFSEAEIAALLTASDELVVRYPVIVRGPPPPMGTRWISSGGAPIAGIVVDAEQRGDFSLVQLELPPLPELFEELDFSISAEQLIEDGLLQPVDTSNWEDAGEQSLATTNGRGIFEFSVGPFLCRPPSALSIRPTFTQEPAPASTYFGPIWDGSIHMSLFKVDQFFFKVGVEARAFFAPELRITPGVQIELTCDLKDEHRERQILPLNGALALVLAPYIEGLLSSSIKINVSGGPTARFGANIGFDYSYWTGGSYTDAGGWQPLCPTFEECSRTNQDARLIWAVDSDFDQITMEGSLGFFGALEAGIAGAGGLLALLDRLPVGPLLNGAIDTVLDKMKIRILRGRVGPELSTRWHNAKRTAFIEASEGAANVVITGDVVLTLNALNAYIQSAFRLGGVRNIPLIQFPAAHIVEPFRLLREETITVNGQRPSSEPIEVGRGREVSVVSTVERDFLNLTLIQLFLTRYTPHEEFPYLGELWLDGDPIAELMPLNDFTLMGSFTATPGFCDAAEANGGIHHVQILAYNRMFGYLPTANFVGKFDIACTENLPPFVLAGSDQEIELPDTAILDGTVEDDGQPDPPGRVTSRWSATGPGTVSFGNRTLAQTTAKFSATGVYTLTLTANDGEKSSQDSLTITVKEQEGDHTPPQLEVASCGGLVDPGDTIQITVEATDETAMGRLEVSVPTGFGVPTSRTQQCPATTSLCRRSFDIELSDPLPSSAFEAEVEAFDAAGNRATRSCTYRDPDSPSVPYIARKIVDSNTVAPGTDQTFGTISRFVQNSGNVVFQDVTDGINLYGNFGSGVEIVADKRTVMPLPFGFNDCKFNPSFVFSLQGDRLAFENGSTCTSSYDHVFYLDIPSRVSGTPAGMTGFSLFNFFRAEQTTTPELAPGMIFYVGLSGESLGLAVELPRNGDFTEDSDALFVLDRNQPVAAPPGPSVNLVDVFTPIPGGTGTFLEIREVSFEDDTFAFVGRGPNDQSGVYTATTAGVRLVADTNTPVPGGTGNFTFFCGASIDGDAVAFEGRGTGQIGVYVARNGGIEVVADLDTLVPGKADEFRRFRCDVAFDDGRIAFIGSDAVTSIGGGLYLWEDGLLRRVIERGDVIDGEPVDRLLLGTLPDLVLDGNDLAVHMMFDGAESRSGIYLVTLQP